MRRSFVIPRIRLTKEATVDIQVNSSTGAFLVLLQLFCAIWRALLLNKGSVCGQNWGVRRSLVQTVFVQSSFPKRESFLTLDPHIQNINTVGPAMWLCFPPCLFTWGRNLIASLIETSNISLKSNQNTIKHLAKSLGRATHIILPFLSLHNTILNCHFESSH